MKRAAAGVLVALALLIAGCSTTTGSDAREQFSRAFDDLAVAQSAYFGPQNDGTDATTPAAVAERRQKLQRAREAFERFKAAAAAVDFPDKFREVGQPARSTVDRVIAAMDGIITVAERMESGMADCLDQGYSHAACGQQVAADALQGPNLVALQLEGRDALAQLVRESGTSE